MIPLFIDSVIFPQAYQDTFNSSHVIKMDFINEWPLSPPHNLKLETTPRMLTTVSPEDLKN